MRGGRHRLRWPWTSYAEWSERDKAQSDEIFDRFDLDKDGYLNYVELRSLGIATGGELPKASYDAVCEEIGESQVVLPSTCSSPCTPMQIWAMRTAITT